MFTAYYTGNLFTNLYSFEPSVLAHTISELTDHGMDVDDFIAHYTPFDSIDQFDSIYRELQAREAGYANWQDVIEQDVEEDAAEEDIFFIRYFNMYTPLGAALCDWYHCTRYELTQHIRSSYLDAATSTIYYVTGCGYNHIDRNLLGGNGDGTAEQTFSARYDN